MRECIKVILGVLALSIGASAPSLIFELLRPGTLVALNPPSPGSRYAQSEHKAQPGQHHNRGQTAQNGRTEPAPLIQGQSPNKYAIAGDPKEEGEWYAKPDWWVAAFTGMLFLSTTGLWIVTGWLYRATRQAVVEGQKAISAAQASAAATIRAAEVAERTMILNDRPWVDINVEIASGLVETSEEYEIFLNIIITNYGRSPAIGADYFIELCPSSHIASERHLKMIESANRTFDRISVHIGTTLFPNSTRESNCTVSVSRRLVKEISESATEDDLAGLFITACAYYGLPTGGRFRHTSYIYEIMRKDDKSVIHEGALNQDDVWLLRSPGETT